MLDGDGGACGDRGAATATAVGGDTPDDGVTRPCLGVLGVLGAKVIRRRRVRGFGGPPCSSVAAADAAAAAIVAASRPLPPLVVPAAPLPAFSLPLVILCAVPLLLFGGFGMFGGCTGSETLNFENKKTYSESYSMQKSYGDSLSHGRDFF